MFINVLPNSDFLLWPGTKGINLIDHVTNYKILRVFTVWENRQHLAMPPLVSPWNDVWEMSVEIPYWWRFTTQIWIVTRHQYGISVLVSQTWFCRETVGGVAKCCLFSKARVFKDSNLSWNCHVKCKIKWYSFFINYYHDVDEGDNDDMDESGDGGVGSDFNNKKYCWNIFNIFMK